MAERGSPHAAGTAWGRLVAAVARCSQPRVPPERQRCSAAGGGRERGRIRRMTARWGTGALVFPPCCGCQGAGGHPARSPRKVRNDGWDLYKAASWPSRYHTEGSGESQSFPRRGSARWSNSAAPGLAGVPHPHISKGFSLLFSLVARRCVCREGHSPACPRPRAAEVTGGRAELRPAELRRHLHGAAGGYRI